MFDSDIDHRDWLHRYDAPSGRTAKLEPCSQCGSREPDGRHWVCEPRCVVFCSDCWVEKCREEVRLHILGAEKQGAA